MRDADIVHGSLQIWVLGRTWPECYDKWDGNWLSIRARYDSHASHAEISGDYVTVPELQSWLDQLKRLHHKCEGRAELECTEPALSVVVELGPTGSGSMEVELAHELEERHEWTADVDQSYLPKWIQQLEDVLEQYPRRGSE